ncbi:MAG TPA: protein-L-isoaspartate(D-aspartate) O-methyltransferase [Longimicrobiales bacterium]|nr:protein-L-isoaspartate(D-aspartate) O-methyltransferase [Longimicrobiales bacterium]
MGSDALTDRRYERQRRQLIETIRERGVDDLEVLRTFDLVPRHLFVPESVQHRAYEDAPLPIGFGQTASQPSLQALYLQTLRMQPQHKVLEIGTGTGYQTALLAQLAAHVYSVERLRELSVRARAILDSLRLPNVALLVGDGTIGWSRYAPYDAILVAAAAPDVPQALLDQLAGNGRLLIPLGGRSEQTLTLFEKSDTGIRREDITACTFVPLLGRFGWAS